MEKLDQTYLNNLVYKAHQGSSNAFAELFLAVYKRHWIYLSYMYEDSSERDDALKETYVRILKGLSGLAREVLFMPWSCRIAFRVWKDEKGINDDETPVVTPAGTYSLTQILRLPVTESQILIMHYYQKIDIREIAAIMNFDRSLVKQAVRSAFRHLKHTEGDDPADVRFEEKERASFRSHAEPSGTDVIPAEVLEHIFDECGRKPNTVPIDALNAYTVYRKERFSLQKMILIAAMVLFIFLPLFFITPEYEVNGEAKGERGLPVYTIKVGSILPVGSVNAFINNHVMPVYEADRSTFSVEPTRNGSLKIEVKLFNRQGVTKKMQVTEVDCNGPVLTGNDVRDGLVYLEVKDEGIGVDYREVYADGISGKRNYPVSVDSERGEIVFEYPDEVWDVYIPDHIGNMLHLSFTFE